MTERTKDWGVIREGNYGMRTSPEYEFVFYTREEAAIVADVKSSDSKFVAIARRVPIAGCATCKQVQRATADPERYPTCVPCSVHPVQDGGDDDERWDIVEFMYGGKRFIEFQYPTPAVTA